MVDFPWNVLSWGRSHSFQSLDFFGESRISEMIRHYSFALKQKGQTNPSKINVFLNRKLHIKKVDKSLLCDFKHLLE